MPDPADLPSDKRPSGPEPIPPPPIGYRALLKNAAAILAVGFVGMLLFWLFFLFMGMIPDIHRAVYTR